MTGDIVCSICVANYNGIGVLERCLRSIAAQECDFDYEIIVHDDCSTDSSVAYVREHHPDVRLIESDANVGFCVSNTRMANAARGEYLLLLNNDTELFPDALRTLLASARNSRQAAILGLPQYDMATGQLVDRGLLLDPFLNPLPNLDTGRQDVAMIIGACMWLPRTLWDELGGFPEWFESLAEDMLLCCLARLRRVPVRIVHDSGFRHRIGHSLGGGKIVDHGLRTRASRRRLSERNKTYVMLAAFPTALLLAMAPVHLVTLILEMLAVSVLTRSFATGRYIYGPAVCALVQPPRAVKRLRRRAQSARSVSIRKFLEPHTVFPHKLRMVLRHGLPYVERA